MSERRAISRGYCGRFAAVLFALSGIVTVLSLTLPAAPEVDRFGILAIGVVAVASGGMMWFLPWDRWPAWTTLTLVPLGHAFIALHNHFGANDPFRYGLFFMVSFCWIGLTQPRWTSVWVLPSFLVAYLTPLLVAEAPPWMWSSVVYTALLCIFLAEALATVASRLAAAEASARRSHDRFLSLITHAADVITLVGRDGIVAYESPAAASVLGADGGGRVGRRLADEVHPDDREIFERCLAAVVAGEAGPHAIEVRMRQGPGATATDRGGSGALADRYRWMAIRATNLLDDPAVGAVVLNASDTTEQRAARRQLADLAFHDPVTGLPNRADLMRRLNRAVSGRSGGGGVALLFLDLDSFKVVNDSLGHEVGDDLLRAVAGRLATCVPERGVLARLGGDEFTILLEQSSFQQARQVARDVLGALEAPFTVGGHVVRAGASVGVAMLESETTSGSELLKHADLAMYEAKQRGKGRYEIFHPRLAERAHRRLVMEAELRGALEQRELILHFQPEFSLADGEIASWEALPRWPHPTRGLLLAQDFVPLAEETGLVHILGQFTLEQACLAAGGGWPVAADACVSVNVSEQQLVAPDFPDRIAGALEAAHVLPQRLTVEVSERILTAPRDVVDALRAVRGMGVRLALDDFGTASSSFTFLKRLPFTLVKLDHSLVSSLGETSSDAAIIEAIVSVAHALEMQVTAEGVETERQLGSLRDMGCDRAQGLHLRAPGPLPSVPSARAMQ